MAPQMVAVTEGLVAVTAHKRCFAFVLLLYDRHWWPCTSPAGHIVFKEIGSTGRRLLVYLDGQDRFLVNWFISSIEERQQAVLGHLVLVVQGFIRLLGNTTFKNQLHIYRHVYDLSRLEKTQDTDWQLAMKMRLIQYIPNVINKKKREGKKKH